MTIISCANCGTVLDTKRIEIPDLYEDETGALIEANAIWDSNSRDYTQAIPCPSCGEKISYFTGDF